MARILALALFAVLVPAAPAAAQGGSAERSERAWEQQAGRPAAGPDAQVPARRSRAFKLDRRAMRAVLEEAPRERSAAARVRPLELSLPHPDGGFHRFALAETQIMEPGLAARHPEITTYAGTGIDEPGATVRVSLTSLGLQASVRTLAGSWYVDPYYRGRESTHVTYRGEDLENQHGELTERAPIVPAGAPANPIAPQAIDGPVVSLRQYRLAFLTDHTYAAYHGAANVTSAKVALINRVNQIYEDDFGVRLVLVAGNDQLNFNTSAMTTGASGPCGGRACFTAAQIAGCDGPTLDRTHTVIGQIIGASNYDVGHIGLGVDGGGLAYLGVAGGRRKGGGCTGVSYPTGDFFAVDYVAHELGHQFAGNHTFNGTAGSCGGNIAETSVEPGSGSSVMAYAGICGADDLQPNTDPYFSQQTITEVGTHVTANYGLAAEYQTVALTGWSSGDSFRLSHNGNQTEPITQLNANTIRSALNALPGLSDAVGVYALDGLDRPLSADGFVVGIFTGDDEPPLVFDGTGVIGQVSETDRGGVQQNGGSTVTVTANRAPVPTLAAASYTIPARTPFALTAEATDADGDTLTYSWEQNDPAAGKALLSNTKTTGPLFRQFHTASKAPANPLTYAPNGQNHALTAPTRVFPDLAQIAANTTNAVTGQCAANDVECFSEFLPTASYGQPMHFRLTVRDGNPAGGGVGEVDQTVNVATGAGPFLVTQPAQSSYAAGSSLPVSWAVANTASAPVNAANVRITLSTDGGLTFPHELAASTPNDGSHTVTLPNAPTTNARIRVAAVGNVFFDLNNTNFTITAGSLSATDSGDVSVDYGDAAPALSVTGTDTDGPGSALTVSAPALPAGLALTPGTTTASARTWNLTGNANAAPGAYPVTATVSDGTNTAITTFTVTITVEDADADYTGATQVSGPQGQSSANVPLEARISDPDGGTADLTFASVRFEENGDELCTATPAANGVAGCSVELAAGPHDIDVLVGGRFTGLTTGNVVVTIPAFSVSDSGDQSVQYSDALGSPLTVTAVDEDSPGTALAPNVSGLPAGMSAAVESTATNTRTWRIAGATTAPPGTYPVTFGVSDGAGHSASTSFTITVSREDALVTDGTDAEVTGVEGMATSPVALRATLEDAADGAAGDLTKATVTFKKGADILCTDTTVTALGAAECPAQLGAGVTAFTVETGGHYVGTVDDSVEVKVPVFAAQNSGNTTVQYSDRPAVTVSATDDNTPGADLSATASGLPDGVTLDPQPPGAGLPGTRSWTLAGKALAAPGAYPVTVTVHDGDGHTTQTSFTITVVPETVDVVYSGPAQATGEQGAASALVPLMATITDPDGSQGDLTNATVTFAEGSSTLCTGSPCNAALGAGPHPLTVSVGGGYYTGAAVGDVTVSFPAFTLTGGGDRTVQYSDPLGTPLALTATDEDSPGSALTPTAQGLPAGLTVAEQSTGSNTRSWRLDGPVTAAPGSYPVAFSVSDGDGHSATTTFTITVSRERATPSFTGAGARLAATVAEEPDGSPGDLSLATLTFTGLCADLPVTAGGAACTAALGTGTHTVRMVVGGRYAGEAEATTTEALPTPTPVPVPTVAPPAVTPALVLSKIARTVRVKRQAFRLKLACLPAGGTCTGTLTVRAKKTVVAKAKYTVNGTRSVTFKLTAKGRRLLKKKPLAVRAAAGKATRGFKLRR